MERYIMINGIKFFIRWKKFKSFLGLMIFLKSYLFDEVWEGINYVL